MRRRNKQKGFLRGGIRSAMISRDTIELVTVTPVQLMATIVSGEFKALVMKGRVMRRVGATLLATLILHSILHIISTSLPTFPWKGKPVRRLGYEKSIAHSEISGIYST